MKKYGLKYHINLGKKSNYPACCILWFLVKLHLYRLLRHYDFKFKFLNEGSFLNIYRRHACCLYHFTKAIFIKPVYYKCQKCGWHQLEKKKCNECDIRRRNLIGGT